ncbi:MAG: outer membrane beta-barrel protein [Chitinophagaceae bacterium]
MKKICLLAAVCLAASATHAQIQPRSVLLGGQFGYSNVNTDLVSYTQKSRSTVISLQLGKALKKNTVTGILLGYSPQKETRTGLVAGADTATITARAIEAGLFLRWYKLLGKGFYLFGETQAAYMDGKGSEEYKLNPADMTITDRGGRLAFTGGIAYQLLKRLQVELVLPDLLGLQYRIVKRQSESLLTGDLKQQLFSVYSNISRQAVPNLGIGFRFVL